MPTTAPQRLDRGHCRPRMLRALTAPGAIKGVCAFVATCCLAASLGVRTAEAAEPARTRSIATAAIAATAATTATIETTAPAATTATDSLEQLARRRLIESGSHPAMRWGTLNDVQTTMRAMYDTIAWTPLWLHDGQPTPQARALIRVLVDAASVGLTPADFDAGRIGAMATYLASPVHLAAFEVALSANAIRFVRSLREGRIAPERVHAALKIPREHFDAAQAIRSLATSEHVGNEIAAHEPPFVHYALVKQSLVRLRALAAETTLTRLPPLPQATALREGNTWVGTPQLLRLMSALGDAPAVVTDSAYAIDSLRLTPTIIESLARFQRRTGLESDGVLGRATHAMLTRPVSDKLRALELTLERWRWLPRTFSAPPLIVNVPAFRLYAFAGPDDDEQELLRMDVVVGSAFDTRTPIFSDTLTTIAFSPFWDVPISIARGEILPRARRDAGYLARNHYEIVRGDRDDSPSLGTGPDAIAAVLAGRARLRQTPGPHNALGRVKFLFPNSFNVYFHDTPAQAAFNRARRDVSHGCIRLADPVALAQLLLADDPAWTPERIAEAMSQTRPVYVRMRQPRPVFLMYATAMSTQDGETRFYPDIYGFDDQLASLLADGFPYKPDQTQDSGPRAR